MSHTVSARIDTAILQAVAYADVFDYPLTVSQMHRYLVRIRASLTEVRDVLANGRLVPHLLVHQQGYYFLPGRDEVVETRRRRAEVAARMWPLARRYGAAIARLPFVRMVAVTGALAVDNVEPDTDIDYFIVTEPGRLWLCRALVVALVHLAARRGDVVCPNYFLSERAIILQEPGLFTAHELAQMVPLWGLETYRHMCRLNSWATHFLPNAFDEAEPPEGQLCRGHSQARDADLGNWRYPRHLAEAALRTPVGSRLEHWEMRRKVRKFRAQAREAACREGAARAPGVSLLAEPSSVERRNGTLREAILPMLEGGSVACGGDGRTAAAREREVEAAFSADRCKGHFDRHGQRTMKAFGERMRSLALAFPPIDESMEALESELAGGWV